MAHVMKGVARRGLRGWWRPERKTKPLTDAQLAEYERTRDFGSELLESVRQMKAGQGKVVYCAAIEARKETGLSQSRFPALPGVAEATLTHP